MSTLGQRLKEARQNKEIDIQEVYLKIKISPKIIEALEEDKAEKIVDFIYAKNFLKEYANFLGLDGEALAKEYGQTSMPKRTINSLSSTLERPRVKKLKLLYDIKILAILILILLVIVSGIVLIVKKSILRKAPGAIKPALNLIKTETTANLLIPKNKKLTLTITTSDKVWIKLKSDGKLIVQNILSKKSKETWQADDYFELSIGKPEAVKLELNGRTLALLKNKKIKEMIINHQGIKLSK